MGRAALLLMASLAWAGAATALADDADPPARVGRLSLAEGSVSLQPAGLDDWGTASINRPLTTGDKLWADQDSRAEVELGSAAIRLGSGTGFSFLNLDDQTVQVNVTAGTAIVHVRDLADSQSFEIDTPNVAVTLVSPGDYRVEVADSGDNSVVKVSDGDAEVAVNGATIPVRTQQAVTFSGTEQVSAQQGYLAAPDALDSWSLERDRRLQQAAQADEYVSPDVAGAEDLSQYGAWESTPDYGPVWTPSVVAAGWAPYQSGRWIWVSPWGWTWVDEAPWGFVPFHYGRWAYYHERWCWVPGPRHVRPVYAPALVAWVGRPGPATALVVGGAAAVAWFALGPREVYVPSYRASNAYVRNVNVTNTIVNNTYITNVYENKVTNVTYVNRDKPGAVAAVPQNVFASGRPVRGQLQRVQPAEIARLGTQAGAPSLAPARASVLASPGKGSPHRPPAALFDRPVVARRTPPPPAVPFDRQQAALRANGGRPLGRTELAGLQSPGTSRQIRLVTPGPVRSPQSPLTNRTFPGTARPEPSLSDRERTLHASPLPPAPQRPAGIPVRADRPPGAAGESLPERAVESPNRRDDMYRPPQGSGTRATPEAQPIAPRPAAPDRMAPEDRPAQPSRQVPEARPLPQARPYEPARSLPPPAARPEASHPSEPRQAVPRQAEPRQSAPRSQPPKPGEPRV